MSIYVLTGRLGNGKSLLAVRKIQEALRAGRRVATNLDLWPERMLPSMDQSARVVRVPDKPSVDDLDALGKGSDVLDESRYGLLVLDELGSWLNSRDWADKGRQGVIDWLIHSRKKRWDVIFVIQHSNMMDKQIREALMEYLVTCKRLDKVRIPIVGRIGQLLSLGAWNGRVGKVHLGVVVYAGGSALLANAIRTDVWVYRGTALYQAYDTEQEFSSDYPHGPFSYLTPWHVKGRYEVRLSWWHRALSCIGLGPAPRSARVVGRPAVRLEPLMRLPRDLRWIAARRLVDRGIL